VLAVRADDEGDTHMANEQAPDTRYRALFEAVDQGACIIQMLFDREGCPCDYRFVELNPAFERHTGLRSALGRTMRELAPQHEQWWFDVYGRVARTGEPTRCWWSTWRPSR
jgi:PAS domain-containing protein